VKERIIAQRYARALVELAFEQKELDQLASDLARLAEAVRDLPLLMRGLADERVALERRLAAAGAIAASLELGAPARHALMLLMRKERVELLPLLIAEAEGNLRELRRMAYATARVADGALAEEAQRRIAGILSELLAREVSCGVEADPGLLGGVVVHLGDRRYDCSIAGKLERMEEALLAEGALPKG
jgi:F-type H+-transporting ATPase subunit delta